MALEVIIGGPATRLEIRKLNEIDVDAHARLIYDSRQNSPLRSEERTIDGIKKNIEEMMEHSDSYVQIVAKNDAGSELLGQLTIWLDWGEIGVARPWQPIVHPSVDQEAIAIALIEHSKKIVETHSKKKLEVWMYLNNDQAKALQPTYADWYQKCGFIMSSEEYLMETEYSQLREREHLIPEGIEVIPMSRLPNDELRDLVFKTFRYGTDKWIKSQTDSQLYEYVDCWLQRDESFDAESSIVFKKDGELIGYNVIHLEDASLEIGPVGVLPSQRGRGLGRTLLLESIKRASGEVQTVRLSVSIKNDAAFNLYTSLGFEKRYIIQDFSWSPR